jgi:hypothetical protein
LTGNHDNKGRARKEFIYGVATGTAASSQSVPGSNKEFIYGVVLLPLLSAKPNVVVHTY